MKKIPLTQGKFALVDDEDYEWLMQWKWYARHSNGLWYAARNSKGGRKEKHFVIHMHRIIMQTPKHLEVDHLDNNGLNNQKYNMRNCTHEQNQRNHRKQKNNISGFIGVTWDKNRNKYISKIKVNYKTINLGRFSKATDAAKAYDVAAKKFHGEFATLNYPNK